MKHKGLFLDDERIPSDVTWVDYPDNIEWTVVRTYDKFLEHMKMGTYSYYSFDHDIQDFYTIPKGTLLAETAFGSAYAEEDIQCEYTGYDASMALCEHINNSLTHCTVLGYYVHSKNPIGSQNIRNCLGGVLSNLN